MVALLLLWLKARVRKGASQKLCAPVHTSKNKKKQKNDFYVHAFFVIAESAREREFYIEEIGEKSTTYL